MADEVESAAACDGEEGSITQWISALKAGDPDAAQSSLWERYFDKLVRMAAARLQGAPGSSAVESEESAALTPSRASATRQSLVDSPGSQTARISGRSW